MVTIGNERVYLSWGMYCAVIFKGRSSNDLGDCGCYMNVVIFALNNWTTRTELRYLAEIFRIIRLNFLVSLVNILHEE